MRPIRRSGHPDCSCCPGLLSHLPAHTFFSPSSSVSHYSLPRKPFYEPPRETKVGQNWRSLRAASCVSSGQTLQHLQDRQAAWQMSWEMLSQVHAKSHPDSWYSKNGCISKVCCFKLLNVGVVCCSAIHDLYKIYSQIEWRWKQKWTLTREQQSWYIHIFQYGRLSPCHLFISF